jgi:RNA polymerase sigma-70 factor (ECF subfamily)
LRGAQQGKQDAIEQLLNRHRASLQRMVDCRLNQQLGRRVGASDIVQDALLSASRRLNEYIRSPSMPFHAWLRHLARDRLADAYRRELAEKRDVGREQHVPSGEHSSLDPVVQIQDAQLTPAAMLLRKEFVCQFQAALERLEEDAKEIVVMRHAEQLTNSQAAEILGLSEAAAGMRYLRALRQLKTLLGGSPSMWLE